MALARLSIHRHDSMNANRSPRVNKEHLHKHGEYHDPTIDSDRFVYPVTQKKIFIYECISFVITPCISHGQSYRVTVQLIRYVASNSKIIMYIKVHKRLEWPRNASLLNHDY